MWAVGITALAWVASLFPAVVRDPNAYFYSNGGDGIKNYFVAAYFMKYDQGQHFSGMNYPFGEHFTYPDLQPLVSGLVSGLRLLGLPGADYAIGLLNLLVLGSMVLTPVVLYAILRRTRLPVAYAALTALLIAFMSPQNNRLDGHMTLSYSCFVPILWYILIRIQEAPRQKKWYVAYGVASIIMALFTAYYLAAAAFFLLAHVVVVAWQELPRRKQHAWSVWKWLGWLTATALLPLLLFRGWLWLSDPVLDRPTNPFGFSLFVANFNTVFVPVMEPFMPIWQRLLDTGEPNGEGLAYIGMVADLVLVLTLGLVVVYLVRRRWRKIFRPVLPAHLRVGLWAALLLLLLAMGYPFAIPGLSWLADVMGPIKQFRSMGRFAWPFYYVAGVYAAYYLYRLTRYLRLRWHWGAKASLLPLLPLLALWATEAYVHSHQKADRIGDVAEARGFVEDANNYTELLSWANRKPADFQAILPLPFYAIGTDKLTIEGSGESMYQSYKAALNTGLPLVAMSMGRSSVGQTLALTQLFSSEIVPKTLVSLFPSTKPLLLLVTPHPLSAGEQRVLAMSRQIATKPGVTLYELPVSSLAATSLPQERALAAAVLPTLRPRAGGLLVTTSKGVILESFSQGKDRRGRLTPGAFHEPLNKFSTLYEGPLPTPLDTGRYEVSVWVNAKTGYGLGNMQVKQFTGDNLVDHQVMGAAASTEVSGDWVRVVVPIRVKAGTNRISVLYENQDLLADDLLIRPVDTDVYHYIGTGKSQQLVKNTYLLGSKL